MKDKSYARRAELEYNLLYKKKTGQWVQKFIAAEQILLFEKSVGILELVQTDKF